MPSGKFLTPHPGAPQRRAAAPEGRGEAGVPTEAGVFTGGLGRPPNAKDGAMCPWLPPSHHEDPRPPGCDDRRLGIRLPVLNKASFVWKVQLVLLQTGGPWEARQRQ